MVASRAGRHRDTPENRNDIILRRNMIMEDILQKIHGIGIVLNAVIIAFVIIGLVIAAVIIGSVFSSPYYYW